MAEDHGRPSLCHSCLFNIAIRAFFSQGQSKLSNNDRGVLINLVSVLKWGLTVL